MEELASSLRDLQRSSLHSSGLNESLHLSKLEKENIQLQQQLTLQRAQYEELVRKLQAAENLNTSQEKETQQERIRQLESELQYYKETSLEYAPELKRLENEVQRLRPEAELAVQLRKDIALLEVNEYFHEVLTIKRKPEINCMNS